MRKISNKYLLISGLLLIGFISKAQDFQYSQFFAAPLYLNPAFAGASDDTRVILNHRRQWPGLDAQFISTSLSYDYNWEKFQSGIGVIVNSDVVNPVGLRNTEIGAMYSYTLDMLEGWSFKAGFQYSYVIRSLDFGSLTFGDQFNDRGTTGFASQESFEKSTKGYSDVSIGGLLYSRRFFAGGSAHHINTPNQSFDGGVSVLPAKISLHSGFMIPLRKYKFGRRNKGWDESDEEKISLTPSIVYMAQGKYDLFSAGLSFNIHPIFFGAWYKGLPIKKYADGFLFREAIAGVVGVQVRKLKFGYSYDFNISRLSGTQGAHEISLQMDFETGERGKKKGKFKRNFPCPTF